MFLLYYEKLLTTSPKKTEEDAYVSAFFHFCKHLCIAVVSLKEWQITENQVVIHKKVVNDFITSVVFLVILIRLLLKVNALNRQVHVKVNTTGLMIGLTVVDNSVSGCLVVDDILQVVALRLKSQRG